MGSCDTASGINSATNFEVEVLQTSPTGGMQEFANIAL